MKNSAIIFDFDGVLVESLDVKTEVFGKLYAKYGTEIERKVREYHLANGGMSRHVKFRWFHENLLGKTLSPEEETALAESFSDLVENAVVHAPFVVGAEEFLEEFYRKIPFFIASGTPEEELRRIIEKRGMSKYFRGIYGSPRSKTVLSQKILTENNLDPSQVLFVGDALADFDAAQATNIRFIGRRITGLDIFPNSVPTVDNLFNLSNFL